MRRDTTEHYAQLFDFDCDNPEEVEKCWHSIPILTRANASAGHARLFSKATSDVAGGIGIESVTSGSTGTPLHYRRSKIALVAAQAMAERLFRWWGVNGNKALARITVDRWNVASPPDGAASKGWHSAHPEGPLFSLASSADITTQLNWLAARRADYLTSYANILKELAKAASGATLSFDLIFSLGTVVDVETRERCRFAFGCEIADSYGAGEIGQLAAQCRECGVYHISSEAVLIEVLRPDGSAARPGEIGRVIVTGLYNYAMPLIRYEIGDLAEVGSADAACGRGLPSLRRILGRFRNAFRFRDGTIAFPQTHEFKLWDVLPARQVQIIQLDMDQVEIRWVSDGSGRSVDPAALTEQVRKVLRQPVEVRATRVDTIGRLPSGKFEECIRRVPEEGVPAASERTPNDP
jgi:phenylacetate-CoA ligase